MIARAWRLSAKDNTIQEIDVEVDCFGVDDTDNARLVREVYNFAHDLELIMIMEEIQ